MFRCMADVTVTIKFKVASAHQSSVVIEFSLYLGDMKEPCPLSSIRDCDKDSSKRNSETRGDCMPISLHTYPCWLLPTFKRPSHLEMLTWSLLSFGPLTLSVCTGEQSVTGKERRGQPSA